MERTYDPTRRVVKVMSAYLPPVTRVRAVPPVLVVMLVLALPPAGVGQGLPAFAPLNPVASSRTGLSFQPFRDPAPGRWTAAFALDYASVIEYNQLPQADYVLDSEVLRISFGVSRDLGTRSFLTVTASVGGAYAGFLDGFLDWYHGTLGIRVSERERRPTDRFRYTMTLPDGRSLERKSSDLFLGDVAVGFGVRLNPRLQTMLSLTLPTSTGPEGYGRGVPSVGLLTTFRTPLDPRMVYEGSLGVGHTPTHGSLADRQRTTLVSGSSGLRYRFWGSQSLFANLFYHSPYYRHTSLPSLDRRELSLDFGWLLNTQDGGEWRVGLTEDLEPGGPGVDLVLRVGRTF
jgi:hypothetical protein